MDSLSPDRSPSSDDVSPDERQAALERAGVRVFEEDGYWRVGAVHGSRHVTRYADEAEATDAAFQYARQLGCARAH